MAGPWLRSLPGRGLRVAVVAVLAALLWAASGVAGPARQATAPCQGSAAPRSGPEIRAFDPRPGAPRVFAMQFKQDVANVVTYSAFATKIDCLIRRYVLPYRAVGRPNVVVFNEDVGLMTLAIGSRGAVARDAFARRGGPGCESQGVPCTTLGALAAVTAAYAPQLAAYRTRFTALGPVSQAFVGATDTIVRGFMEPFSTLARRYGLYLIGSADLAPFTESSNPLDVATFADPDQPRPSSVYVASAPQVYNQVFMWGPDNVRSSGPAVLRNMVATNRKVPLTPIENEIGLSPGPATGPEARANLAPYALPGSQARIGFATSLPAFVYGDPPPGTDPCSDTSRYYMRCLDELGANLVIQDEANPGRWTGADGDGVEKWQPLSWMASTYRTVSDPTVHFDYNVTAMMVGNLADLPFDGQSAITQRGGLAGPGCHYIGNGAFVPGEDRPDLRAYAGRQRDFLAIAPWVVPDASRSALRATGARLAPGSGDPLENDYRETAIVADLPFPPDPRRQGCAGAGGLGTGPGTATGSGQRPRIRGLRLTVRPRTVTARHRTRFSFVLTARAPSHRRPVIGARVTFAGQRVWTGRRGRARITARIAVPGRRIAVARGAGRQRATAVVHVVAGGDPEASR